MLKEFLLKTKDGVLAYIKADIITSIINTIVIGFGLYYGNIPLYGLIAVVIGIIDLLPIIGTGIVLVPWAVIVLIQGNLKLSAILFGLFALTFLINQIVQPLILGKKIGLKPLYTLGIVLVSMIFMGLTKGAIVGSIVAIAIATAQDLKRSRHYGSWEDFAKGMFEENTGFDFDDEDIINI